MAQSTDMSAAPDPSGVPVDTDAVVRVAHEALAESPPRRHEEITRLEAALREHVVVLLPRAEATVDRLWHGGVEWYGARSRLDGIRRLLDEGPGAGLVSAHRHVAGLARCCLWLVDVAFPQVRQCRRCEEWREDTRMIAMHEAGSGPGGVVLACRGCVPRCPLDDDGLVP